MPRDEWKNSSESLRRRLELRSSGAAGPHQNKALWGGKAKQRERKLIETILSETYNSIPDEVEPECDVCHKPETELADAWCGNCGCCQQHCREQDGCDYQL